MKVVRVEKILEEAFSNIETIEGQDPIWFGYGNSKELDAILTTKISNGKKAYPLLWYVMPNSLTQKDGYANGNFNFILAHNTRLDWFNDQRFNIVFEKTLFPYFEKVIDAIDSAKRIYTIEEDEFKYTNHPNYSYNSRKEGKPLSESKQIDIWDAMTFDIELSIKNNNCR